MTRKLIIGVTGVILLVAVPILSGFAAEKAKGKKAAEKPEKQAQTCEQKHPENLLDQLVRAYEAKDRQKMGEIIKQMQERREKMREFAKFKKWHRRAHRNFCGEQGRTRGMGNCGFAPPCQRGWQRPCGGQWQQKPRCGAMAGWGPPAGMQRPMPRWREQPGEFGPMRGWGQGKRRFGEPGAPPPRDMPDNDDQSPETDW